MLKTPEHYDQIDFNTISNILTIQKHRNISDDELASYIGLKGEVVRAWESEKSAPTVRQIQSLSKGLSISVAQLTNNVLVGGKLEVVEYFEGNQLAKVLKKRDINTEEFANAVGITPGKVKALSKNEDSPSAGLLLKIADYFNYDITFFRSIHGTVSHDTVFEIVKSDEKMRRDFKSVLNSSLPGLVDYILEENERFRKMEWMIEELFYKLCPGKEYVEDLKKCPGDFSFPDMPQDLVVDKRWHWGKNIRFLKEWKEAGIPFWPHHELQPPQWVLEKFCRENEEKLYAPTDFERIAERLSAILEKGEKPDEK